MAGEGYKKTFYAGADYGLDPNYGGDFSLNFGYRMPVSQFGIPSDPRQANQLKAVSDKLNTGAKTIEVSGVTPAQWEMVPEQHLKEIERLKKLSGVDLTFHGPLVEPTGVSRQGWNEAQRLQAERQMWSAVERAHKMDSKGNIVVTFHSSNGLPDPQTKVMEEVTDPNTGKKVKRERITDFWVVSNDGQFQSLTPKPSYFKGEEEAYESAKDQTKFIQENIEKQNKDAWYRQLQGTSFHAYTGKHVVEDVLRGKSIGNEAKENTSGKEWQELYGKYLKGEQVPQLLEKVGSPYKEIAQKQLQELAHGDIYLRDAYQDMQKLFDLAYESAKKNNYTEDLNKLKAFRSEVLPHLKDLEDPTKVGEFGDVLVKGINVLRSVRPPENLKPLREFAIDKSSDTFSNIAFSAYKKFGDTAPIISVENPPAGMGLSRANDLRDVVKAARDKLEKQLIEKQGMSDNAAKEQAKKLIGVTWDVGHINMIRKLGYGEKELESETKTVAPFVKHVHLSDNFGMEHTELPMGMGNVPTKKMLDIIREKNAKAKHIIETGNWFGPQAFGNLTPFRETLRAFGSPVYSMKMAPYWNQYSHSSGGYFAGYGRALPEQHFSIYGAGFSNLPPELGGQMSGKNRLSGAPME